jgi:hypothetical protein
VNQTTKLLLALYQVENLMNLIADNEFEHYLASKLVPFKIELQRQLTNLNRTDKIKE